MKKILTIDDQPINLITAKAIINSGLLNCESLSAKSGKEGIESAIRNQPDTILLDIVMPEMDGFETCKILKSDERTKHIPVIMVSAIKIDKESRIKGLTAGADSFISKPIDPDELVVQINVMLRIKEAEDKLRAENQLVHQRTDELQESKEGYREMSEILSVIAYEHNLDGKLTFINTPATTLLGYSQQELENGFDIYKLFVPEDRERLGKNIKKLLNKEKVSDNEYTALRKDGNTFPILIYSSLIRKNDKIRGIRGLVVDITRQKNTEAKLIKYARQLEERNEELDAFSHTVAHDLKSPLGTIEGFASLLDEDFSQLSQEEIKNYLSVIIKSSAKAQQIITSLLLFASVRKSEIKTAPLDMGKIFEEALKHFPEVIDNHDVRVSVPDRWPHCLGYAPWVEEVWVNYLSNAIKYGGEPTHFEVGAETITSNGKKKMNRFWVRDFGPGITLENQKRLFNTFERLGQVKKDGYGLGLSIVRHIVEKLGGTVGLESTPGEGSLFYFTLPEA